MSLKSISTAADTTRIKKEIFACLFKQFNEELDRLKMKEVKTFTVIVSQDRTIVLHSHDMAPKRDIGILTRRSPSCQARMNNGT